MPEIKRDCFAYKSDDKYNGCFCLNELYCIKKECSFYQERKQAKKKYLENFDIKTAEAIAKETDRYFRKL